MTRRTRRRRPGLPWFHAFVAAIRRFIEAIQHVRTGGATTRRRAIRRAEAPPKPCPTCKRPMPHSADWRDHIH